MFIKVKRDGPFSRYKNINVIPLYALWKQEAGSGGGISP